MREVLFQLQPGGNVSTYRRLAAAEGLGLEVTDFAFADLLDSDWRDVLTQRRQLLQDFRGTVSIHGVFMEMVVHSHDRKIREVARTRISHNLEIAAELGARYAVFHSNFLPLIKEEGYRKVWLEGNARFWSEMIDRFPTTILMENLWDSTPAHFRELLELIDSPRFGVCLDIGHINVFSDAGLDDWLDAVGSSIGYMHVHDNHGGSDEHLTPGEGNIDWTAFSNSIDKHELEPGVLFEVDSLEKSVAALEFFRKGKIYPFNREIVGT
jgi:sugar phosphate isomerase/epimerase